MPQMVSLRKLKSRRGKACAATLIQDYFKFNGNMAQRMDLSGQIIHTCEMVRSSNHAEP